MRSKNNLIMCLMNLSKINMLMYEFEEYLSHYFNRVPNNQDS